jgi:hypothetical protein
MRHDILCSHRRIVARALVTVMVATGVVLCAQSAVRPGPTPPGREPEPRSNGSGGAVIRGTVLAGDTGAPLRAAAVTLVVRDTMVRAVATDRDGHYVFRDVVPGRYTVAARRSGYLRWTYGQHDEHLPGRTLDVVNGQQLAAIDITLPRNSAIVGRITDEYGAPLSEIRVRAWRARVIAGRRRFVPEGAVRETDDLGVYRLFGFGPGEYYVTAVPKTSDDDGEDIAKTITR